MNNKKRRISDFAYVILCTAVSFGLFWWAYLLFNNPGSCEPDGLKLSLVIRPVCAVFGQKAASMIPLVLGVGMLLLGYFIGKNTKNI